MGAVVSPATTVELLTTSGTLFTPVVKVAVSLPAASWMATCVVVGGGVGVGDHDGLPWTDETVMEHLGGTTPVREQGPPSGDQ